MANPTTNFGWVMPAAVNLVTDLPADFDVFGQAVDTDFVGLKGGTTGQVLAKASGTDLDFVWSADAAGMTNPMTTTADIIYSSSGSTPARLGIGSTNDVLTVAGGVPTWAAAGGGMTLLGTYTADNTAATFTIGSIPGTYKHLLLVGTALQSSTTQNSVLFTLNGDTGANYTGTGFGYYAGGLQNYAPTGGVNGTILRSMATSTDTILRFGCFDMWIYDYASTSNTKNFSYRSGSLAAAALTSVSFNGFWNNSADAVTTITVYSAANFNAGVFKLYGVS
jgi:hypothetical protein